MCSSDLISKKDTEDVMRIVSVGFSSVDRFNEGAVLQSLAEFEEVIDTSPPKVEGLALCYPNPFRQASEEGGTIGYKLTNNGEIVLHVYDMRAQRVVLRTFEAGSDGGKRGYNKIQINKDSFDGHVLSAGVYFYLLLHNNEVLAKGKMAVKP